MKLYPRFKQDAVIGMAILVVLIALWRLYSHPKSFGGLGSWAETNIFGGATLNMLPGGAGQGEGEGQPSPPITPTPTTSNQSDTLDTNPATALTPASDHANRPTATNPPPMDAPSTNLLNTNGPVTMIAVPASDLVEAPPGVATAVNVPEAAAIARRLGEVSAKGGDIQISLSWQNVNDLDLHCVDPAGEEICFSNRKSRNTGGELDIDQNAHLPYNTSPVENIYWPAGGAPAGLYRIFVVYYAPHGGADPTTFLVRTVVQGKTNFFRSSLSSTGTRESKLVCNLRYDPSNANPAQRFRFVQ